MRPRFSIRFLWLVVTALAFACYWAFVRPTIIAREFARLVDAKQYANAELYCKEPYEKFITDWGGDAQDYRFKVELLPREWWHVLKMQQPMLFRSIPIVPLPHGGVSIGQQIDVVATSNSVKPSRPVYVRHTW